MNLADVARALVQVAVAVGAFNAAGTVLAAAGGWLSQWRAAVDDVTAVALLVTAVAGAVALMFRPVRMWMDDRDRERRARIDLERKWSEAAEVVTMMAAEQHALAEAFTTHARVHAGDIDALLLHHDVVAQRIEQLAGWLRHLDPDNPPIAFADLPDRYRHYREQRREQLMRVLHPPNG